jgi:hypothetical protein
MLATMTNPETIPNVAEQGANVAPVKDSLKKVGRQAKCLPVVVRKSRRALPAIAFSGFRNDTRRRGPMLSNAIRACATLCVDPRNTRWQNESHMEA